MMSKTCGRDGGPGLCGGGVLVVLGVGLGVTGTDVAVEVDDGVGASVSL
jgi:hypothetical protein